MTSPECIPSLLFFEALGEDEVVYIENAAKINLCVGYKQNFRFAGDFLENTKKKSPNVIVAMDAIPFNNISEQFIKSNILIELNKARIAFSHETTNTVLTGKWGCGVFNGDPWMKFMIQWMAASECGKRMKFHLFGDTNLIKTLGCLESLKLKSMEEIFDILVNKNI